MGEIYRPISHFPAEETPWFASIGRRESKKRGEETGLNLNASEWGKRVAASDQPKGFRPKPK